MDAPTPDTDLDSLTISDLESLLADKRRRQGTTDAAHDCRAQPKGNPPPGRPRGRHAAGPGRAAPFRRRPDHAPDRRLGAPPRSLSPPQVPASPPPTVNRFGRAHLTSPDGARPRQSGWLQRPSAQRLVDRSLQLAEVAIVLVLLLVVGEWAYSSYFQPDDSSDLFATASLGTPGTPPRPHTSVTPLTRPGVAANPSHSASPTATPTPLLTSPHLAAPVGAAPGPTVRGDSRPPALPGAVVVPTATPTLTPSPTPSPAPTEDPTLRLPIRMVIPKIKLDIRVREVELQLAADQANWEVADFMAGHHTGTRQPRRDGQRGHRRAPRYSRQSLLLPRSSSKKATRSSYIPGWASTAILCGGSTIVKPTRST